MYKVKKFKTKTQVSFKINNDADKVTLVYNKGGNWHTKVFKKSGNNFTCCVEIDKNANGLEFIYNCATKDSNYYINEDTAQLIDNPFGTKNSFINF